MQSPFPDFPHQFCVSFGSNLGDSLHIVLHAWRRLQEDHSVGSVELSSPYRTQPVGMVSDNQFINAAAVGWTSLEPEALLLHLQGIEKEFGRVRAIGQVGYQDRTLDLDLLLYDDLILNLPLLVIPHPEMQHRMFVLQPLAEIAAAYRHPVSAKTVIQHLEILMREPDADLGIEKLTWPSGKGL